MKSIHMSAALAVMSLLSVPVAAQGTPEETAAAALDAAPVWDGHNDVPIQMREAEAYAATQSGTPAIEYPAGKPRDEED